MYAGRPSEDVTVELAPPHLEAWCHPREDERLFTVPRIHCVIPA
ncbi:hypothetical protein ABT117_04670 [Streptomyces sp. NPDC002262]